MHAKCFTLPFVLLQKGPAGELEGEGPAGELEGEGPAGELEGELHGNWRHGSLKSSLGDVSWQGKLSHRTQPCRSNCSRLEGRVGQHTSSILNSYVTKQNYSYYYFLGDLMYAVIECWVYEYQKLTASSKSKQVLSNVLSLHKKINATLQLST